MLLPAQRESVIKTALQAREMGLVVWTFGNFSLRDDETGYICLTPSGMDYAELRPADVVVMDVEGKIIEGQRQPSVEAPLHCLIYRKRPDVRGICHTHSVYATAWACVKAELLVVVAEVAALVGGKVPTAPYRPMGTKELAAVVAETLGEKQAVLLANHGQLTVGPDLNTALANAVIVEEGARIAYYATGLGELNAIPAEECAAIRRWALQRYGQK